MTLKEQRQACQFVDQLARLQFRNVFNPYAEECPAWDKRGAAIIRQRNLKLVLEAALNLGVRSIWVARDLGYRGGRRTGLALTDEVNLAFHAKLFSLPTLERATVGPVVAERTANVVWRILRTINQPIFLWNVFPLHPHSLESPMSNRRHTCSERAACWHLMEWLLETLKPQSVVALGRDAQKALSALGVDAVRVRHPSFGGQNEFITSIANIYGLTNPRTAGIQMLPF